MSSAVLAMRWESYTGEGATPALFDSDPLAFNSRQELLHQLAPGDRLWLVSRSPSDNQYYVVAVLLVMCHRRNPPGSREYGLFGEYAIIADRSRSVDLGESLPAEGPYARALAGLLPAA